MKKQKSMQDTVFDLAKSAVSGYVTTFSGIMIVVVLVGIAMLAAFNNGAMGFGVVFVIILVAYFAIGKLQSRDE